MTIEVMLGQSGILAFLGMAVVFGFLIILVIVISLAGKVIKEKAVLSGQPDGAKPAFNSASDGGQITAAISAAVNEYRKS